LSLPKINSALISLFYIGFNALKNIIPNNYIARVAKSGPTLFASQKALTERVIEKGAGLKSPFLYQRKRERKENNILCFLLKIRNPVSQ